MILVLVELGRGEGVRCCLWRLLIKNYQPFENEAFGMTATLAIRHQVFPILLWHQDHHHLAINPSLPVHIHMIHIFLYGHLRVCV